MIVLVSSKKPYRNEQIKAIMMSLCIANEAFNILIIIGREIIIKEDFFWKISYLKLTNIPEKIIPPKNKEFINPNQITFRFKKL